LRLSETSLDSGCMYAELAMVHARSQVRAFIIKPIKKITGSAT